LAQKNEELGKEIKENNQKTNYGRNSSNQTVEFVDIFCTFAFYKPVSINFSKLSFT
tara:strand:+ start:957 stop:1124 length:168 start_codon:yes stop_codon:yes gene_type:complete